MDKIPGGLCPFHPLHPPLVCGREIIYDNKPHGICPDTSETQMEDSPLIPYSNCTMRKKSPSDMESFSSREYQSWFDNLWCKTVVHRDLFRLSFTFRLYSKNLLMFLLCFSASYDTTVKLWELERGSCVLSLSKHQEAVHSLSFSPDGRYIASGSFDRALNVWSTQVGNIFTLFPIMKIFFFFFIL